MRTVLWWVCSDTCSGANGGNAKVSVMQQTATEALTRMQRGITRMQQCARTAQFNEYDTLMELDILLSHCSLPPPLSKLDKHKNTFYFNACPHAAVRLCCIAHNHLSWNSSTRQTLLPMEIAYFVLSHFLCMTHRCIMFCCAH